MLSREHAEEIALFSCIRAIRTGHFNRTLSETVKQLAHSDRDCMQQAAAAMTHYLSGIMVGFENDPA